MSDEALLELLRQARAFNEQQGITGVLLYSDGNVLQVLEGDKDLISGLYEKIQADPRHVGVIKLADKAITARSFASWSMGFKPVGSIEPITGYIDPATFDFEKYNMTEADALLLRVLQSFVFNPAAADDE